MVGNTGESGANFLERECGEDTPKHFQYCRKSSHLSNIFPCYGVIGSGCGLWETEPLFFARIYHEITKTYWMFMEICFNLEGGKKFSHVKSY